MGAFFPAMDLGYFILDGKTPKRATMAEFGAMYEGDPEKRRVARTELAPGIYVSTVFLGLDHNFNDEGPPILFETMAFDDYGELADIFDRYATWDAAEAGHARCVADVEAKLGDTIRLRLKTAVHLAKLKKRTDPNG